MAGNRVLVERATVHLSAPGVDGGATFNQYKNLFQVLISWSMKEYSRLYHRQLYHRQLHFIVDRLIKL